MKTLFMTRLSLLLLVTPAFAHHSFAMFDPQKQVTLVGVVREMQYNNPHCFIQLVVPGDAQAVEWSIEMGSPMHLMRVGWKPHTVKAGDKITVIINPLKDGGRGGNFVSATDANGKPIGAIDANGKPLGE